MALLTCSSPRPTSNWGAQHLHFQFYIKALLSDIKASLFSNVLEVEELTCPELEATCKTMDTMPGLFFFILMKIYIWREDKPIILHLI